MDIKKVIFNKTLNQIKNKNSNTWNTKKADASEDNNSINRNGSANEFKGLDDTPPGDSASNTVNKNDLKIKKQSDDTNQKVNAIDSVKKITPTELGKTGLKKLVGLDDLDSKDKQNDGLTNLGDTNVNGDKKLNRNSNEDDDSEDNDADFVGRKINSGARNVGEKIAQIGANPQTLIALHEILKAYKLYQFLTNLWKFAVAASKYAWNKAINIPIIGPLIKAEGDVVAYLFKGSGNYLLNGLKLGWNNIASGEFMRHPLASLWGGTKYLGSGLWAGGKHVIAGIPKLWNWITSGKPLDLLGQMAAGIPKVLSGIISWGAIGLKYAGPLLKSLFGLIAKGIKSLGAVLISTGKSLLGGALALGKATLGVVGISTSNIVAGTVGATLVAFPLAGVSYTGYELLKDHNINYPNTCSTVNSTSAFTGGEGTLGVTTGLWTTPGTPAYNNAKAVWDYWAGKGLNGAQIAGILGNIGGAEDTNFVLDQKEIGGGSGGGLYQFTPYTKYTNWSGFDHSWSAVNQGDFILASEKATVQKYLQQTMTVGADDAATAWMKLYERASAKAQAATNGARRAAAVTAFNLFNGASVTGNTSLLDGATSSVAMLNATTASALNALNCLSNNGSADGNILNVANQLVGYFTYENLHGVRYVSDKDSISSVSDIKHDGVTDCSGFVWLVLKLAGYKVPNDMAWYTGSMEKDAKGPKTYLKEIPISEADAGDIVIVNMNGTGGSGADGHTLFLTAKPVGISDGDSLLKSNTPVIQEGGGSHGGVNKSTMRNSFGSQWWGNSSVTVARPVTKAADKL